MKIKKHILYAFQEAEEEPELFRCFEFFGNFLKVVENEADLEFFNHEFFNQNIHLLYRIDGDSVLIERFEETNNFFNLHKIGNKYDDELVKNVDIDVWEFEFHFQILDGYSRG